MSDAPALPYVLAPGRIPSLLEKNQQAQTPPRFTLDFLDTKLGMKGGSATPLIPLLKRIGLLENDGLPTELYRKYRNPDTAGAALARGLRKGYSELFSRNGYAHELTRDKLTNLVVEITGKEKEDRVVSAIVATFWTLKELANFDGAVEDEELRSTSEENLKPAATPENQKLALPPVRTPGDGVGLNLSYTINLNLPATDDINVFNAIFKSLKENMLKG